VQTFEQRNGLAFQVATRSITQVDWSPAPYSPKERTFPKIWWDSVLRSPCYHWQCLTYLWAGERRTSRPVFYQNECASFPSPGTNYREFKRRDNSRPASGPMAVRYTPYRVRCPFVCESDKGHGHQSWREGNCQGDAWIGLLRMPRDEAPASSSYQVIFKSPHPNPGKNNPTEGPSFFLSEWPIFTKNGS
jgi:hypothetical protein